MGNSEKRKRKRKGAGKEKEGKDCTYFVFDSPFYRRSKNLNCLFFLKKVDK